jgi:PAS domain S-box-containing protein
MLASTTFNVFHTREAAPALVDTMLNIRGWASALGRQSRLYTTPRGDDAASARLRRKAKMAYSAAAPSDTAGAPAGLDAVRTSDLLTAAILESALDCIITADHHGRITEFNPAAERTFGYRRQDVVGLPLADVIVPPSLREQHHAGFARFLATGEARVLGRRVEITGMRSDGSEFPIELAITPITLHGFPFFTAYLRDITERKRSEEELRRSEAYLAEGQRLSRTGSWGWNPATGRMFLSREMLRIYGFDPAEPPPAYDALRSRIHPADLPAADHTIEQALHDLREFDMGYRLVHLDGSITHIRQVGHPVLDGSGRLVEFIGTVVDVTERMRAERRLRRAIRARYEAVLEERVRIARDMHDGLLQNVAGIALQIGALLPHVQTAPDAATERLKQILELTERTGREARQTVVGMRRGGGSTDLVTAVGQAAQSVATQSELAFSFNVKGRARSIRPEVCDVAASVVHEAMTNVLKHAHARVVKLSVRFGAHSVRLSVRDDGQGLVPHHGEITDAGHFGLVGMRERATSIGARFAVRSTPGRGMLVRLDAPYRG